MTNADFPVIGLILILNIHEKKKLKPAPYATRGSKPFQVIQSGETRFKNFVRQNAQVGADSKENMKIIIRGVTVAPFRK